MTPLKRLCFKASKGFSILSGSPGQHARCSPENNMVAGPQLLHHATA